MWTKTLNFQKHVTISIKIQNTHERKRANAKPGSMDISMVQNEIGKPILSTISTFKPQNRVVLCHRKSQNERMSKVSSFRRKDSFGSLMLKLFYNRLRIAEPFFITAFASTSGPRHFPLCHDYDSRLFFIFSFSIPKS